MMTSALLEHGISHLARIRAELGYWLAENGYESVRCIQGQMGFGKQQVLGTGLTKYEAEHVLDWLEAHGRCQLSAVADGCFTVTAWRSVDNPEVFERVNYMQVVTSYRPEQANMEKHPLGEFRGRNDQK